jgi:hypothetical protein
MATAITLVRAIGSEFVRRKLRTIIIIFAAAAVVLLGGAIWLTTVDAWWWLLAAPIFAVVLLGALACLAATLIVRIVRPALDQEQRIAVSEFVDKLERVAENVQTPMPLIVFRVVRDLIRPRKPTFIESVASDSTTLHSDLIKLRRSVNGSEPRQH